MLNSIKKFLKDESGQTSTEYILLVAVVVLIVFKFKDIALKRLIAITDTIFGKAQGFADEINTSGQ